MSAPWGRPPATSRLARNFDVFDDDFNANGPTLYGKKVRWISGTKLYQLYQKNPAWFAFDDAQVWQDYVTNSRELSEQVAAAYLRADVRLLNNKLWLVGGMRFERTHDKGSGPRNDINAQYQRNANGTLVDGNPNVAGTQPVLRPGDALTLRKLRYQERAATSDQDYSGFYPSLNASYNLTENLIIRAAYAQTLGRPNINNIIPSTTISDASAANPVISVNNSGLKPWSAKSYDLSIESYQIKDGFGSVGVFQKEIKDFFTSVTTGATPALLELYGLESDQSLLSYNVTTLANGTHLYVYNDGPTQRGKGWPGFPNGGRTSLRYKSKAPGSACSVEKTFYDAGTKNSYPTLLEVAPGDFRAVWDSGDATTPRTHIQFGKLTLKP